MDRENRKVHLGAPALKKCVELGDRMALHAKLQAAFDREIVRELLARGGERLKVARVVDVDDRLAVDDARVGTGDVGLYAVVNVVGKADLGKVQLNGVAADVGDVVKRVVAERGVHVVVGKHAGPFVGCVPATSVARNLFERVRRTCQLLPGAAGFSHHPSAHVPSLLLCQKTLLSAYFGRPHLAGNLSRFRRSEPCFSPAKRHC